VTRRIVMLFLLAAIAAAAIFYLTRPATITPRAVLSDGTDITDRIVWTIDRVEGNPAQGSFSYESNAYPSDAEGAFTIEPGQTVRLNWDIPGSLAFDRDDILLTARRGQALVHEITLDAGLVDLTLLTNADAPDYGFALGSGSRQASLHTSGAGSSAFLVRPGDHTLLVFGAERTDGYPVARLPFTIQGGQILPLTADMRRREVTLALDPGSEWHPGFPSFDLVLTRLDGQGEVIETTTGPEGQVFLSGLRFGRYSVAISAPRQRGAASNIETTAEIEIAEDQALIPISMTVARVDVQVTGLPEDPDRAPYVSVIETDHRGFPYAGATVDAEGRLSILYQPNADDAPDRPFGLALRIGNDFTSVAEIGPAQLGERIAVMLPNGEGGALCTELMGARYCPYAATEGGDQ